MAGAAHHVRRAEHGFVADLAGELRDLDGQRELGDMAALAVIVLARGEVRVVVRSHRQARHAGGRDQAGHARRHVLRVAAGRAQARTEGLGVALGALGVLGQLAVVGHLARHHRQVIVDGEQADAAIGHPGQRGLHAGEVIGLEAQVHLVGDPQHRLQVRQGIEHTQRVGFATQAAFPGQRHAVEFGRDAVRQQLAVHVEQRARVRKAHAGARHHGALEGIAMDVDDAGQHQQIARIDAGAALGRLLRRRDAALVETQRCRANGGRAQHTATRDAGQPRRMSLVCRRHGQHTTPG
ncbi:hypothetical protein D3C86_1485200 [compost metagenome]